MDYGHLSAADSESKKFGIYLQTVNSDSFVNNEVRILTSPEYKYLLESFFTCIDSLCAA